MFSKSTTFLGQITLNNLEDVTSTLINIKKKSIHDIDFEIACI